MDAENAKFDDLKVKDAAAKEEHLRLFRPNLANPANKEDTQLLNTREKERTDAYIELIDETQLNLLEIEQGLSTAFNTAYLNNTRALIKLFDGVIYKEQFIMLPGDEIVEKKHKNIKHLIAMERSEDLSKRPTRKFPGLGNSVFQIDFAKQFASVYGAGEDEEEKAYESNATRPGSSKATSSAMKKPQSPKGGKRPASPAHSAKSEV